MTYLSVERTNVTILVYKTYQMQIASIELVGYGCNLVDRYRSIVIFYQTLVQ